MLLLLVLLLLLLISLLLLLLLLLSSLLLVLLLLLLLFTHTNITHCFMCQDLALVSIANIFHRVGMYDDAATIAKMAIEITPQLVINHFTLANVYSSKVRTTHGTLACLGEICSGECITKAKIDLNWT